MRIFRMCLLCLCFSLCFTGCSAGGPVLSGTESLPDGEETSMTARTAATTGDLTEQTSSGETTTKTDTSAVTTDAVESVMQETSGDNSQPETTVSQQKESGWRDYVRFFGRTYDSKVYKATMLKWSNSGFEFTMEGTAVSAVFVSSSTGGAYDPYIKVFVDGEENADLCIDQAGTYSLASGLSQGEHRIKVVKRTESMSQIGLRDLIFDDGAIVCKQPDGEQRRIEFIGDSITCGFGNIAPTAETSFQTRYEDSTKTFSWLICQKFQAECLVLAESGNGISRNNGGGTEGLIPQIYPFADGKSIPWDFSSHSADVVCINLGTNDAASGNAVPEDFVEKSVNFLGYIRSQYPQAYILWSYGIMIDGYSDHIQEAVAQYRQETGDTRVEYLQLEAINKITEGIGTGGHPSEKTHQRVAGEMEAKIAEAMGW